MRDICHVCEDDALEIVYRIYERVYCAMRLDEAANEIDKAIVIYNFLIFTRHLMVRLD